MAVGPVSAIQCPTETQRLIWISLGDDYAAAAIKPFWELHLRFTKLGAQPRYREPLLTAGELWGPMRSLTGAVDGRGECIVLT